MLRLRPAIRVNKRSLLPVYIPPDRSPLIHIPLPKRWFLSARIFWLGLLVTGFFLWLTIDSLFYMTAYRTIHRGSLRDWSGERVITGAPDEVGDSR